MLTLQYSIAKSLELRGLTQSWATWATVIHSSETLPHQEKYQQLWTKLTHVEVPLRKSYSKHHTLNFITLVRQIRIRNKSRHLKALVLCVRPNLKQRKGQVKKQASGCHSVRLPPSQIKTRIDAAKVDIVWWGGNQHKTAQIGAQLRRPSRKINWSQLSKDRAFRPWMYRTEGPSTTSDSTAIFRRRSMP